MKKVPSKWTKQMFLSASWYALMYAGADVRRIIAHDLHDVLLFGFAYWKNCDFGEYSVDYTKYKTDLFK